MDTILNLGLNDKTVEALSKKTSNERFAKDSYRRFIQMYGNVVLGIDSYLFEEMIDNYKLTKGVLLDTELNSEDWNGLIDNFKKLIRRKQTKISKTFMINFMGLSKLCFYLGKVKERKLIERLIISLATGGQL